mmetsp:Transcript_10419/g.26232  ORF Transcript_10419/g.26232 Transcript_10419/m.26232 type:complete len:250 (+) Transcript_10419:1085-1834(+)
MAAYRLRPEVQIPEKRKISDILFAAKPQRAPWLHTLRQIVPWWLQCDRHFVDCIHWQAHRELLQCRCIHGCPKAHVPDCDECRKSTSTMTATVTHMTTFPSIRCESAVTSFPTRSIPSWAPVIAAGLWQAKKNEKSSMRRAATYGSRKPGVGADAAVLFSRRRAQTEFPFGSAARASSPPTSKLIDSASYRCTRGTTSRSAPRGEIVAITRNCSMNQVRVLYSKLEDVLYVKTCKDYAIIQYCTIKMLC